VPEEAEEEGREMRLPGLPAEIYGPSRPSPAGERETLALYLMWSLWPGFLVAGIAEVVFFSLVDPLDLRLLSDYHELPRLGIYSLGFFFFWAIAAGSSALSLYLGRRSREPSDRSSRT